MHRPSIETEDRIGVAILAKAPIPGLAKTRLIPRLGENGAALLQRWLLQRTVAMAIVADVGPVTLWCTPDIRHPDFALCRTFGSVTLRQQPNGDLGERMRIAIEESPTRAGTLVIGTDCPALTSGLLRSAAETLSTRDAVVIPAEDGGYVLIGMRDAAQPVFRDIDWSTGQVMAQTRERLKETGWQWSELGRLWDVDRLEDYLRLRELFPEVNRLAFDQERVT